MWIFTLLDTLCSSNMHAFAQLMDSVEAEVCVGFFVRNWGYFTIWKLAATPLCPNLQVTQRIYSAIQIRREEIWGSVQQVCSEAWSEAKNISFRSFSLHLFTRLDTLRSPLAACAKIVAMEITIHQGNFNIFQTCSREETVAAAAIKALL